MKNILRPSAILSGLFLLVILMSSFSLVDAREDARIDSREDKLSKQEQRRQERFEKRKDNIAHKISHAKSDKKKQALQKKMRGIQKKQDGGNPIFGVLGMVFALIAVLIFLLLAITATMGLMMGGNPLAGFILPLLVAAVVSAFLGLGLSITGMVLQNKNPDTFSGRGFALAGIIIGAITFGIGLIALGIYVIFL